MTSHRVEKPPISFGGRKCGGGARALSLFEHLHFKATCLLHRLFNEHLEADGLEKNLDRYPAV